MRVTQKMTAENAIYNINKSQYKLNQLNELLSSNQNINRPSDDPIGSRQILDLMSQVRTMDQYMSNISNAQTWTSVANTSLQGMSDMLSQAKSAASNVLGSMDDPSSVTQALATLENVRQQLVDLANVQVADQYVFGGFKNATPVVSNKKLGGIIDVSKPPNQITFQDINGLSVGMTVTGKGIQPDTTVTAIDSINKIVTVSKNPIASGSGFDYTFGLPTTTQKWNTTLNSSQYKITGISTSGLKVGDSVTGPGVPLNTTITSIDNAGQVTISNALTQSTSSGSFNFLPRIFQTGDAAVDDTTISNIDTTGFHTGGTITGTGIPDGTTVIAITGSGPGSQVVISHALTQDVTGGTFAFTPSIINTGSADATTGLDKIKRFDTSNLTGGGAGVGDSVTGPGVPPGTTILSVDSANQITISNPLTAAVSGGIFTFTPTANTPVSTQTGKTAFTTQISGLDTTNLKVGMSVSGPGVPPNTIIEKINSSGLLSFSQPLTQASTGGIFTITPTISVKGGSTTALTNAITGLADPIGLPFSVGMAVSGPNIPANTKITAIDSSTPGFPIIYLNNNATATAAGGTFTFGPTTIKSGISNPPNQITGLPLAQLQNLYIGMKVTGPGVPENTTITDIDTTDSNGTGSVTLSKIPTGPGGAGQFIFEGYIDSYGDRTMMGTLTSGSSNISGLPSTANMIAAPIISKTGSTNPSVNPNQITGLADTNGLTVGMPITDNAGGTIIPSNTIVTGIDPVAKSVTLSNPITPPVSKPSVALVAAGANTITVADISKLFVGMSVRDNANGTIIPSNTTVTSIGAGPAPFTIGISQPTTQDAAAGTIFSFAPTVLKTATSVSFNFSQPTAKTGTATLLSNQITALGDTNNLFVGMPVSDNAGGTIIPANTTITAIDSVAKTITLSNPVSANATGAKLFFTPTMPIISQPVTKSGAIDPTANANLISGLANTDNLFVGMPVSDSIGAIPANTTITYIDPVAKTITLSNPSGSAPTGTSFSFAPVVAGINQIAVDPTNLFVGMVVSGPGIPANTKITGTPTSIPPTAVGTITLSNSPTVTSSAGTFNFGQYSAMTVSGTGIKANSTIGSVLNNNSIDISTVATATSAIGGTELTFSGHFAAEDIKVNINKSSQVALNYSGSKLLLGGVPPAATQASGASPSTLPVNILGTIGELIAAIQNKNSSEVTAAAANLKTATEQVYIAQTEYAARTSRLDNAETTLTNNRNTLKEIINNKQTLDTAKTIIQLQQQTTAYQAALQGTAKILPMSLMDYIK